MVPFRHSLTPSNRSLRWERWRRDSEWKRRESKDGGLEDLQKSSRNEPVRLMSFSLILLEILSFFFFSFFIICNICLWNELIKSSALALWVKNSKQSARLASSSHRWQDLYSHWGTGWLAFRDIYLSHRFSGQGWGKKKGFSGCNKLQTLLIDRSVIFPQSPELTYT